MSDIIPGFTAAEAAYDNAMPAWFEDKDLPEPREDYDYGLYDPDDETAWPES